MTQSPTVAAAAIVPTREDDPDGPRASGDLEALHHLYRLQCATVAGFETMVEKAEPSFRSVAADFLDLHRTQAAHIASILSGLGSEPDDGAGVMGAVNKAVVTVRSWFDEIDDDVMDSVRRGEDTILEAFDEALAAPAAAAYITSLTEMRADLNALLARTRHLD